MGYPVRVSEPTVTPQGFDPFGSIGPDPMRVRSGLHDPAGSRQGGAASRISMPVLDLGGPVPGHDREFFVSPGGLWIPGDCLDPTELDPTFWSFHRASQEALAVFSRFDAFGSGRSLFMRGSWKSWVAPHVCGFVLALATLVGYGLVRQPMTWSAPTTLAMGAHRLVDPVESLADLDQIFINDAFYALADRSESWHMELLELDQLIPRWGMSPKRIRIASGDLFGTGTRSVLLEGTTTGSKRLRIPDDDQVRHLRVRRLRSSRQEEPAVFTGDDGVTDSRTRTWFVEMESDRPDQNFTHELSRTIP